MVHLIFTSPNACIGNDQLHRAILAQQAASVSLRPKWNSKARLSHMLGVASDFAVCNKTFSASLSDLGECCIQCNRNVVAAIAVAAE